jgi:ABC-type transport system substrate-binding protein
VPASWTSPRHAQEACVSDNPILGILKILAFSVLAFFIAMVFWQRTELEDKVERLIARVSSMEESTQRAAGAVERLEKKFKGGTSAGTGAPAMLADAKKPEDYAWGDTPPPWVKGRAADLWGANGDNFLQPDPDLPASISLDDPRANPEGEVTFYYGSNPPHTNAFTLNEADFNRRIRVYCHEFLAQTHTKNGYRYRPELAYRVEPSKDYKQWVVWIRPGVKWHTPQVDLQKYPHLKGEHYLTADDFRFTFETVLDPTVDAAHSRSYLEGLERVEVVDDHCFILHWNKASWTMIGANLELLRPVPKFVYGFDESGTPIEAATRGQQINEHWFGREYQFVGTGPYFVRSFRKEDVVICERFPEYWGELPVIKRRVMQILDSTPAAQTKFQAGEFAYMGYRVPQLKKDIQTMDAWKEGKLGQTWGWSAAYMFIGYKNTHPIFKDVKVRQAMTHACNRVKLLDLINEGRGKIISGPSFWRAPTAPKDVEPLQFDLTVAAELLKEAGWADTDDDGILDKVIDGEKKSFEVVAKVPSGSPVYGTIFKVFSEDLLKIGVKVEVQTLQWAQYLKDVTEDRNFEISCLGWNTTGWDNDFTQIWHSNQISEPKSSNFVEFSDSEVDRLIDQARTTFDENDRIKVQGSVHRRIHDLQPYTFLFTLQTAAVWWKDQISDLEVADRWVTRPFMRLWPVYVPTGR